MLEIGSLIDGKYKILSVIGQGGMSTVYLAMNEKANKPWAIKEVRKDGRENFEIVKQSLVVETNMLKRLSNPHLPSIIDVIDSGDCFLIVMDYIEGNTLLKNLEEYGALPQENVIEWAKQLCSVLSYLHTRKHPIIYRDLKPGNIMLKPDGNIVLIDFGTARTYKAKKIEDTTCLGTRGYAAPEQFGDKGQTDARTDIYCLGATLYHLVTGHNPSMAPYKMYPIRRWNPHLSASLEKIITKCTQENPNDRYNSCVEVLYDLEHLEELDNRYRKNEISKLTAFIASIGIAFFSLILAISFHGASNSLESGSYEAFVSEAKGSLEIDDKITNYTNAITLDPKDARAYIELLTQVYLEDDNLSADEDEQIREILITKYDDSHSFEDELAQNVAGYEDFAYRLGMAYFYCYENEGNKNMAIKWLSICENATTLDGVKVERAKRLSKIANYYSRIGKDSKSGDAIIGYGDYFRDLCEITKGDIAKTDNSTTALMVYKEMISQIYKHCNEFKKDGISYEEMNNQLENIKERLKTDIDADSAQSDRIEKTKSTLEENLKLAQRSLNEAFGYKE